MIKINYSYFMLEDHIASSIDMRIKETLKLLKSENDYLQFNDGKTCRNEADLRKILKEKGIL